MMYDGAGRRVSKTSMRKAGGEWDTLKVTHYTGIGTEIREEFADSAAGTKVVVPMPQGLGRYGIENASSPTGGDKAFEWYLKNHLGSTMLVYGTTGTASGPELKHAYDYRSFGEQIDLTKRNDKVTENFTGKEKDDETELNYFGARYLDPMLGVWTSVDPMRQFASPYLYAGNGVNPVNGVDPDGKDLKITLTNERYQVWMTSHVNKLTGGDNRKGQVSQTVPLYKMTIENESGSTAQMPVTRDAIAGKGPFNVDGTFNGEIRNDGKMGFRIELRDPETNSPAIRGEDGVIRTNVQIHIGPGCSMGCSLVQGGKEGRAFFEGIVNDYLLEDQKNGFSNDITVETHSFVPFDEE
jgi:RHS repeat-associated protein